MSKESFMLKRQAFVQALTQLEKALKEPYSEYIKFTRVA